jgi:hypothetical protein
VGLFLDAFPRLWIKLGITSRMGLFIDAFPRLWTKLGITSQVGLFIDAFPRLRVASDGLLIAERTEST